MAFARFWEVPEKYVILDAEVVALSTRSRLQGAVEVLPVSKYIQGDTVCSAWLYEKMRADFDTLSLKQVANALIKMGWTRYDKTATNVTCSYGDYQLQMPSWR